MPDSLLRRRARGTSLRLRRELDASDQIPLGIMLLVALVLVVVGSIWPAEIPYTSMVLPMFVGSLWLSPRSLPWFVIVCLLGVCVMVAAQPELSQHSIVRIAVTFAVGLLIVVTSFRRARLGVSGPRSESMFIDLRDRIAKQGQLPPLPPGWYVESVLRSAGGTAFAGDFVVAGRRTDTGVLDLVLVDVSGKGVQAGTRALLLSGAFGGLLSALPADRFLPAASDYLMIQDWDEGFASAIQLRLDLTTGVFSLRKAGHPPAIWLQAGSGTWQVLDSDGPLLGIIGDPVFEEVTGTLRHGDALLLYTDGLVETVDRDIHSGIDKLAGRAQRLMTRGFHGGAAWIMDEVDVRDDDRALILVHRP